jgi:hypothetical protein
MLYIAQVLFEIKADEKRHRGAGSGPKGKLKFSAAGPMFSGGVVSRAADPATIRVLRDPTQQPTLTSSLYLKWFTV